MWFPKNNNGNWEDGGESITSAQDSFGDNNSTHHGVSVTKSNKLQSIRYSLFKIDLNLCLVIISRISICSMQLSNIIIGKLWCWTGILI